MEDYLKEQFESSARLISVAGRLLAVLLQKELRKNSINVSTEEWRILFYLWIGDGITQKNLAEQSSKDKTTITRQINNMEKKGLVLRKTNPKDKRHRLIFLTDYAKGIEKQTFEVAQGVLEKAEEDISSQDIKVLKKVLKQIINNLKKPKNDSS